jgi:hypothetical protein
LTNKPFITEKEAAQRYCYSASWFRKRRSLKEPPPYIKVNGKILYDVDVVDAWFRERTIT